MSEAPEKHLLRVGFITEGMAGHTAFSTRLAEQLTRLGRIEQEVYRIPPAGPVRKVLSAALPLPDGWDFDLTLARNQLAQTLVSRRAVRRMVRECDVLHVYSQNACPWSVDLIGRRPYVVTTDGSCAQTCRKLSYRYPGRGTGLSIAAAQIAERSFLARATTVVAQSRWAGDALVREARLAPDRVRVLHLGAPHPQPWVERPCRDPVRVVFVGTTMRRKGGWALLDVLAPDLGRTVELHLVTRESVPSRPGVVVHNDVRPGDGKVERVLADGDIFAFPSDMDMSPNSVLEAMAAGLPVVAYRTGGIPDMVVDGETGFLVDEGDRAGLARSLTALRASHELRLRLGRAGRAHLEREFHPERGAAQLAEIILGAAETGRRPDPHRT